MNKSKIAENLEDSLVHYYSNTSTAEDILIGAGIPIGHPKMQEMAEIMAQSQQEWDSADCDKEKPTTAQDTALDAILESTAQDIVALV